MRQPSVRSHRSLTTAVVTIALLLAPVGTARADEAKKYEVRLTRPDKVGDKFELSGEGALIRRTVVTVGDDRTEQEPTGSGVKLEGTAEVLAVTPKGKATKVGVTITRCVKVSGPGEKELLPKRAMLIVEAEGKDTRFSLKEGELPEGASEVLELLFHPTEQDDRATDDELFGTKEKQSVGATWPMDGARAAKDFGAEGVAVDPADVTGDVKLAGVEQADGAERLKVSGTMNVKHVRPGPDAAAELPDGIKPEGGSMRFKFDVSVPADPNDLSGEESISVRHQTAYSGKLPSGKVVRTEVTMERAAQMKRTPVK